MKNLGFRLTGSASLLIFAAVLLVPALSSATPSGGGETPPTDTRAVFQSGNLKKCDGNLPSFKLDPPESGSFTSPDGSLTVDISVSEDGRTFDWKSDGATMDKVQVKGGPNTYVYPASVFNKLRSPTLRNGNIPELSHITFCYQPPQPVKPVLECVWPKEDGGYLALWGTDNPNRFTRNIPVGPNNIFTPPPENRNQPTSFDPGRSYGTTVVPFDGTPLTWKLDSFATTASKDSPKCSKVPVPVVASAAGSLLFVLLLSGVGVVALAFGLRRTRFG